jgi:hypothetical protein
MVSVKNSYLSTFGAFSKMADERFDGHFTLLKFTTDWRCCFGTPIDINPFFTGKMAGGKTPEEAMAKALRRPEIYNVEAIFDKFGGEF